MFGRPLTENLSCGYSCTLHIPQADTSSCTIWCIAKNDPEPYTLHCRDRVKAEPYCAKPSYPFADGYDTSPSKGEMVAIFSASTLLQHIEALLNISNIFHRLRRFNKQVQNVTRCKITCNFRNVQYCRTKIVPNGKKSAENNALTRLF